MLSLSVAWLWRESQGTGHLPSQLCGAESGDLLGCGAAPAIARFAFAMLAARLPGRVLLGGSAVPFGWHWDLWLSVSTRFLSAFAAGLLLVVSNLENVLTSGVPLTRAHELHIRESAAESRSVSGDDFLSVSQVFDLPLFFGIGIAPLIGVSG